MAMPIAVDPDIWAFAVDQMEMPDTRSGLEVWLTEIGKHQSQCIRDNSIMFVGVVVYKLMPGIIFLEGPWKPFPRACVLHTRAWDGKRAFVIVLVKQSTWAVSKQEARGLGPTDTQVRLVMPSALLAA